MRPNPCRGVALLAATATAMFATAAEPLLQNTDVFVSGRDGYFAYRIPAIETAPDGTLLAFAEARKYTLGDPGFGRQDIDLVLKRSTDSGATWSNLQILEDPGELWSAANPSTVVDRTTGRVWIFYLRGRPERNTYTARPGTDDVRNLARQSADNGKTWSEPIDLTEVTRDFNDPKWRTSVVGPGGAIQDRHGRLVIPVWRFEPWSAFAVFSEDHGRSWQRGEFVPEVSGDECQLVELADGQLLLDIRQQTGTHRWRALSQDAGRTWSKPQPGETVSPVCCAIERVATKAGGDDRDRILWTGPKGPQRTNLVARVSDDEGRTFPLERPLAFGPAAYSDLAVLKDKTFGVLWERGQDRAYQFITFTRFNRDWLERRDGPAHELSAGRFESLGVPVRKGGLMGCLVGSDGDGGEALYFNFNQARAPLFLVQVDPNTGRARQFNAPQGPGAWAFIVGPDERIYLGTWESGWLLRFDPHVPQKGIEVLGKPAASETYLWQFALGKDGKIYACTYPNAKLVSFDPRTSKMEDLGRMHPTEMYARSLAVGSSGKVYVGIGTAQGDLIVFDPATRQHRSILPEGLHGAKNWSTVGVSLRSDGQVYAEFGPNLLRIDDERVTPIQAAPEPPAMKFRDGRVVTAFDRGSFTLKDPGTGEIVKRHFEYEGAGDMIFVLGQGPNGDIYGSTAMPLEVFRFDPRARRSEHLGAMPGGEVYSMLEHERRLYLCYYGGAVMNLYDPAKRFWKFGATPDCNPVSFGGVGDGHLRPRAMIRGPDGMIYIGSEPPYGQLGGALAVWDPRQDRTVENYRNLVTNQSIVSLAYEPRSGLIFGGSGNYGGGGTKPSETEAKFFAFDPKTKRKVFERALVPGANKYPATFATHGKVFTTVGGVLLVFDPRTMTVVRSNRLSSAPTDISLGQLGDGDLIGLTTSAVYRVDANTGQITATANAPVRISCGFALTDDAVYFGSGAELWRYRFSPLDNR